MLILEYNHAEKENDMKWFESDGVGQWVPRILEG